jgi:hypothetical protein
MPDGKPVNGTVDTDILYAFSVNIPKLDNPPKEFIISVNHTSLRICLRFNAAPITGMCEGGLLQSVTLPWPRVGPWYGFVSSTAGKSAKLLAPIPFQITAQTSVCANGLIGANCNISLLTGDKTLTTPSVGPFGYAYYKFTAFYPSTPFWISVGSSNYPVSASPFQVYVSLSQIPTPENYDLKGCNQPFCDSNIIINLNNTALMGNQTFYVVITNLLNATVNLGVWFNSICAPGCNSNGNGKCTEFGPGTGFCACLTQDWVGFDCNTANEQGLPAQYIVLIIIASLVVASAIIGFIAWAYMQKKRSGYVKVKD